MRTKLLPARQFALRRKGHQTAPWLIQMPCCCTRHICTPGTVNDSVQYFQIAVEAGPALVADNLNFGRKQG